MTTFKQIAKDYAKDHGSSEEQVIADIKAGKLDGTEDDGYWFVRFEDEKEKVVVEKKPTEELPPKAPKQEASTPPPPKKKTLKEQYQSMSTEDLENLLQKASLRGEAEYLCKREINKKLGYNKYELNSIAREQPAGSPAPQSITGKVVVTDIKMPFWSMVAFMVKGAIAAIPAFIILIVIAVAVLSFFGGMLGGIGAIRF